MTELTRALPPECRYCSRPAVEKIDGDNLCKEHVKTRSRANTEKSGEDDH